MLLSASRYREPIESLLNGAKYQRTSFHEEQKGIVDANNDQDKMQCQLNRLESQYKSVIAERDERLEKRLAEMDKKLESVLKLLTANRFQSEDLQRNRDVSSFEMKANPGTDTIVSGSKRRTSKRIQKRKEETKYCMK